MSLEIMEYCGITAYEDVEHKLDLIHLLHKSYKHTTHRLVTINLQGTKLAYSLGACIIPDDFKEYSNIKTKFIHNNKNEILIDMTYEKMFNSKSIERFDSTWTARLKMLRKAYKICFGLETETCLNDRNIIDKYIKEIDTRINKISQNNNNLDSYYLKLQDKYISPISNAYTFSTKVIKYAKQVEHQDTITIFMPNKEMLKQLSSLAKSSLVWGSGHVCIDKTDNLPISIIVVGSNHVYSDNYIKVHDNETAEPEYAITHGATYQVLSTDAHSHEIEGLKVIVIKHNSLAESTSVSCKFNDLQYYDPCKIFELKHDSSFKKETYITCIQTSLISGYKAYKIYSIEDTPEQYRSIVVNILHINLLKAFGSYRSLFGYKYFLLRYYDLDIRYIECEDLENLFK